MTDSESPDSADLHYLEGAVLAALGTPFQDGHEIEVLRNGDEIFPAMLGAIDAARESIDLVTFVYWTGDVAEKFAESLARKAREGVRVRVILDAFGSSAMEPSTIDVMIDAGVSVERFRPLVRWKFWVSDHRTHRKILVVDSEVAFTGGVGIAEEWEGNARSPDEWRETHFQIRGPAVLGLKASFLNDWRDTGHPIDPIDVSEVSFENGGDTKAAVIDASAQIGMNDAQRLLEAVVGVAKSRIAIQTPYFNPAPELLELMIKAVDRGVEIELIVPGPHIDKRISAAMAESMYQPLLAAGGSVWVYQPTMMHAKVVIVDRVLSIVGSVNINQRSTQKDEEVALALIDRGIARQLEEHFAHDVEQSERARPIRGISWSRVVAAVLRPIRGEM